jgi:signal transduction histidine kinase
VVAGILLKDVAVLSEPQRKRRRKEPDRLVSLADFHRALNMLKELSITKEHGIDTEKRRILEDYKRRELYKSDFLDMIRPQMQQNLAFVHDYKQINSRITQHINVIIENKYSGGDFEKKLERADDHEKAIYWASKLLEEKLIVTRFLIDTSWLFKREECASFRLHGLVHKYLKIYESFAQAKSLSIVETGTSYKLVNANPRAVAVIPHTLIDNAIKYSPIRGKIEISLQDMHDGILFVVSSSGPKIALDERERIFEPFFRGRHAAAQEEDGSGYGLYVSQQIAVEHLGTVLEVTQSVAGTARDGYRTSFSILIPPEASILKRRQI